MVSESQGSSYDVSTTLCAGNTWPSLPCLFGIWSGNPGQNVAIAVGDKLTGPVWVRRLLLPKSMDEHTPSPLLDSCLMQV